MKSFIALVAAFLLLGAAALAWSDAHDNEMRLVAARLQKGREMLSDVSSKSTNAARLGTLDRALYFLRGARTVVATSKGPGFGDLKKQVDTALVGALASEAEIYFVRTSITQAKDRIREAMAIDPQDASVRELHETIRAYENAQSSEQYQGTIAARRIADRRGAIGVPLRDRRMLDRR